MTMEHSKELETFISQALLEVERFLSLPNNSLVDETPLPKIREGVRLKMMEVQLDQTFMGRAPDNLIKHSREQNSTKELPSKKKPSHSSWIGYTYFWSSKWTSNQKPFLWQVSVGNIVCDNSS